MTLVSKDLCLFLSFFWKREYSSIQQPNHHGEEKMSATPSYLYFRGQSHLASPTIINDESIWSANVDRFSDFHILQILGHFSSIGKLGMDIFEVDLKQSIVMLSYFPLHSFNYTLLIVPFNLSEFIP